MGVSTLPFDDLFQTATLHVVPRDFAPDGFPKTYPIRQDYLQKSWSQLYYYHY
jgi:hypothetical protein